MNCERFASPHKRVRYTHHSALADFVNKIEGALQELDETTYWLELLVESGIVKVEKLESLIKETDELIAIFVTIATKVKNRLSKKG